MQPYIDSESSSQTREMQKWNTNPCKQKIINYLNGANDEDLQRLLDFINKKDVIWYFESIKMLLDPLKDSNKNIFLPICSKT